MKGFQTFVPNQDKNRLFLNKKLLQVSSLENIHEFTYASIVKKASTIDVIWFNERKMPSNFFEVELTTDMYNSFIKFGELKRKKITIGVDNPSWLFELKFRKQEIMRTLNKFLGKEKIQQVKLRLL